MIRGTRKRSTSYLICCFVPVTRYVYITSINISTRYDTAAVLLLSVSCRINIVPRLVKTAVNEKLEG